MADAELGDTYFGNRGPAQDAIAVLGAGMPRSSTVGPAEPATADPKAGSTAIPIPTEGSMHAVTAVIGTGSARISTEGPMETATADEGTTDNPTDGPVQLARTAATPITSDRTAAPMAPTPTQLTGVGATTTGGSV